MKRSFPIGNQQHEVSLHQPVSRYPENPILTPEDVNRRWRAPHLQVVTVHNAGIAWYRDNVIMLFRSHLRNGISVLGKAVSNDGLHNWEIDDKPFMKPCGLNDPIGPAADLQYQIEAEAGGVEDPRITKIEDTYYITYSAYHGLEKDSVRICLASTEDFTTVIRHGPMLDLDMRNVVLFPSKFDGKFCALFRPNDSHPGHTGGKFKEVLFGACENIQQHDWQIPETPLFRQSGGPSPFMDKIGPGAPPISTPHGWIQIFHGVRKTMDGNPYVLGVALHDLRDPAKVEVSNIPVLYPAKIDCRVRDDQYVHVPQVVFTCGALRWKDGVIWIYYGGNDTVMNVCFSHEDILAELCKEYPQDIESGTPKYTI